MLGCLGDSDRDSHSEVVEYELLRGSVLPIVVSRERGS
jgi:hypothetical protein